MEGQTYVKPVERFMPARNAETGFDQQRSFLKAKKHILRTASNA
jgi:hypothetical protein